MFYRRFHTLDHNYADKHHYIDLNEKMKNTGGDKNQSDTHYPKSVRILSFSGPYFPAFGLNTENTLTFLAVTSVNIDCAKRRYYPAFWKLVANYGGKKV